MKFQHACKLHNEDEVIDKLTKESIRVLSIEKVMDRSYGEPAVMITGVGTTQGYGQWHHRCVE